MDAYLMLLSEKRLKISVDTVVSAKIINNTKCSTISVDAELRELSDANDKHELYVGHCFLTAKLFSILYAFLPLHLVVLGYRMSYFPPHPNNYECDYQYDKDYAHWSFD